VAQGSLVATLSQAFVAFTIEADNEFESRMPHRTAADRGDPSKTGPWLTSLTYWSNYLRQLPDEGCTGRELARRAGDTASAIHSRLGELHRWGYVRVHPREEGERLVTLTSAGLLARDTWAPIATLVEEHWTERFGADTVAALRAGLEALPVGDGLPLGFPILAWDRARGLRPADPVAPPDLSTLLARAVLAMAKDFDARSELSLAMAQVLTPVLHESVALRDLPLLTGVSKEAISIGVGWLERNGLATVTGSPKAVTLTSKGIVAADRAEELRDELDDRWITHSDLPDILAEIVTTKLAAGLQPPDGGWRSHAPYLRQTRVVLADPVAALPRFPMVSHRGGYPDGS
jgi:DNA-binding MarR family transcriptional regulator